jgi:hypothetical protein
MTPFEILRIRNPIVASIMHYGGTVEDCAVALAAENECLRERISELGSLIPRKARLTFGEVVLWRGPDDAVELLEEDGRHG